jgi:hypothetical protein
MRSRYNLAILGILILASASLVFSRPPIAQPLEYHNFADQRGAFGVANFLNVVSNVPFLLVGVWGLIVATSRKYDGSFRRKSERWPYVVFFTGVALTFFGSSYYHMHPANDTLVWDRLPMTFAFMGILAAMIAERISVRVGVRSLPILVLAGVLSVFYWSWTEAHGQGDLRPYLLVQFGSLFLLLAMLLLFRPRYTQSWCFWIALGFYAAAKLLETFDRQIYSVASFVSGHTLKHLAGAVAAFFIVWMLRTRVPVALTDTGDEQWAEPTPAT